jgi:hypothetical protein
VCVEKKKRFHMSMKSTVIDCLTRSFIIIDLVICGMVKCGRFFVCFASPIKGPCLRCLYSSIKGSDFADALSLTQKIGREDWLI